MRSIQSRAAIAALSALFLVAAAPSGAQETASLPQGDYLETCKNVRIEGKWLKAECPKTDGTMKESKLKFADCLGPIKNKNGTLSCVKPGQIL